MRYAAFAAMLALACSYDFDRYAAPLGGPSAEGGEAGELSNGGTAGKGGAGGASGGSSGASAGKGGSAGAAGKGGAAGSASGGKGGTASTGDSGQGGEGGAETSAGAAGTLTAGSGGAGGGFDCAALSGTTFDGHCYFSVGSGAGLPFTEAEAACATNDGATLVAITSTEEQAALEAAFFPSATDFWIGLSLEGAPDDTPIECSIFPEACPFEWTSGEDLAFTDWALRDGDDEPNYSGACVRIQAADLAWADYGCTSALPAICER